MVDFKFYVEDNIIIKDKNDYDISKLDFKQLKYLAFGNIIVSFDNTKEKMEIKAGLIDYIYLLEGVIASFSNFDETHTFTVSSYDYYSSNFEYYYNKKNDKLNIKGVTDCLIDVKCRYSEFKLSFFKFKKQLIKELIGHYPELLQNEVFKALWITQDKIEFPNYKIR